ncbi:DUF2986 domain-containing protein [Vibrio neptunius]
MWYKVCYYARPFEYWATTMNRKKKINQILKAKQKKQNAKLHKSNKPRYISKAERAKLEAEEKEQQTAAQAENEESANSGSSEQ